MCRERVGSHQRPSVALFISGYMQGMGAKKPAIRPLMATHLVELIGDTKLYGWECVHTYHAIWLQKLEHDHITWADEDVKLNFRRVLMWHKPTATHKAVAAPALAQKKQCAGNEIMCSLQPGSMLERGSTS